MNPTGIQSISIDCRLASAIRISLIAVALVSGVIGPTGYAWGDKGSGSGGGSSGSSGSGSSGGSDSGGSGSGSSGSGSSGGGSDNSGSGSSNSGSGSSGSDDGGSGNSGSGSENSRGTSSDDGSHATPSGSGNQERVYQGGWRERIRNGRYEVFDPQGRSVINRKAIPADALRIDKSNSSLRRFRIAIALRAATRRLPCDCAPAVSAGCWSCDV